MPPSPERPREQHLARGFEYLVAVPIERVQRGCKQGLRHCVVFNEATVSLSSGIHDNSEISQLACLVISFLRYSSHAGACEMATRSLVTWAIQWIMSKVKDDRFSIAGSNSSFSVR